MQSETQREDRDEERRKYASKHRNSENESQNEEESKLASQEDWDKGLVSKRPRNYSKHEELPNPIAKENERVIIRPSQPTIISLNKRNNDLRRGPLLNPPQEPIQATNEVPQGRALSGCRGKSETGEVSEKVSSKFLVIQEGDRKVIETKLLRAATCTADIPRKKEDLREKIKALKKPEKQKSEEMQDASK
eukprot:TRINITY_DN1196_c0_g3_i1.p1 TRINITY_DN1196_c0_g3~~TRINITY_DN1196_c0_g3_i1.p1  ORF type:complete len:191 (+),score=39.00 TRINITY_DN1196_c0_g3_i1:1452-2024(+)